MRPRPYGLSNPLDAISRHFLELPADSVPLEHGGLRRSNDLVGPGNLSIIPKVRKEENPLGPSAAANGDA